MAEYHVVISAETLADKLTYDELTELVGDMDDYLGDWDFTIKLMDKMMSMLPDAENMGAEWMDDIAVALERWYTQIGDLLRAHRLGRDDA